MAPMRGERGGSPARGARASLPLPRRLIRQIARHVASSGRSLRRLEVSGRVIDNFDDIEDVSDESDLEAVQPAVACGGNAGNLPPADHDDDLTSLSWLQDRNLLRGINLTKGDMEDSKMNNGQVLVKSEPPSTPPPASRPPSPPRTPCKAPPSPVSPPAAAHAKPPYSFSCLIFMAIEAAPARALPVKEIYAWIIKHFPYFKNAPQGWKNSVRHNLSLNKCFHKVAAAPGIGKGSLWTVDPQHRATLLQAFGRQPIPLPTPDTPPPAKNAPDPQLFPFLARRLAGAPPRPEPGADEYLAAATVLAMKYGPAVLDQFQNDIDNLKRTQGLLERKVGVIEREVRKKDLIIFGVEEKETSYHQLEETLLDIINNIIGVACTSSNIEHVRRIRKKTENPRPVLFGLTTMGMKINILKNRSNLKDSKMYIQQNVPLKTTKVKLRKGNRVAAENEEVVVKIETVDINNTEDEGKSMQMVETEDVNNTEDEGKSMQMVETEDVNNTEDEDKSMQMVETEDVNNTEDEDISMQMVETEDVNNTEDESKSMQMVETQDVNNTEDESKRMQMAPWEIYLTTLKNKRLRGRSNRKIEAEKIKNKEIEREGIANRTIPWQTYLTTLKNKRLRVRSSKIIKTEDVDNTENEIEANQPSPWDVYLTTGQSSKKEKLNTTPLFLRRSRTKR